MSTAASQADKGAASLVPGRFTWKGLLLFPLGAVLLAMPVALIADVIQSELRFAPLLLFPIILGVGLGALLLGLMRLSHVAHRPTLVLGALLAAAVAVVGQHYLSYRSAQSRYAELQTVRQAFPEATDIPVAPDDFVSFLQDAAESGRRLWISTRVRGPWAWASWGLDAVLITAAVLAMLVPAMRLPYCNGCRSWLRAFRSGRIDGRSIAAMANVADVLVERPPKSGRYRLLGCRGGCGPTGLVLMWEDADGETYSADAWLDPQRRNRLMQIADEAGNPPVSEQDTA
jgi:hypothetical protein